MAITVSLDTILSGYSLNKINTNFETIAEALLKAVNRDGGTNNQLNSNLDLNGYNILNVGSISLNGDYTLDQIVGWSKEWANKAEDSLVSTAAGGNGINEYSALHWANKANNAATTAASDTAALLEETFQGYVDDSEAASLASIVAKTAAESARDATLAAYDSFDDRYLGTFASDPSTDNDGNALVAGSLYFNSVDGVMKIYTGTIWVAAYASGTDFLVRTNNLSDLTNAATARTNLGLGSAATQNSTAFASSSLTVSAGAGLSGGGDLSANRAISLDVSYGNIWTGSQGNEPVTDNDGSFDMLAANDFICTTSGATQITFTNRRKQRGMILLTNASNHSITFGSSIKAPADLATDLSTTGEYILSYWCVDGTNVKIVASEGLV